MKIGGIQKSSFVDYPGVIAAVIFTVGCNMNCFYCHNKRLIKAFPDDELMSEEEAFDFLSKRVGLLDGVVISGGEPTLQKDLAEFIGKVKAMGFKVKLDTNGYYPEGISQIIGLLDFIAMDIKAPFDRYEEFSGVPDATERVKRSMGIIVDSGVNYQFRTTVAPGLGDSDIDMIRKYAPDPAKYVTQPYREPSE